MKLLKKGNKNIIEALEKEQNRNIFVITHGILPKFTQMNIHNFEYVIK